MSTAIRYSLMIATSYGGAMLLVLYQITGAFAYGIPGLVFMSASIWTQYRLWSDGFYNRQDFLPRLLLQTVAPFLAIAAGVLTVFLVFFR